jgi:RNA polymerase sigma-70 factor (ECF subfamily)
MHLAAAALRFDALSIAMRFEGDNRENVNRLAPVSLFESTHESRPTRENYVMGLYDLLRPQLLLYLSTLGLSVGEAEDVIHDCFIRLFDHLTEVNDDKNLRGWIFRVAHNLAMDFFRDARRVQTPDADDDDLVERVIDTSFGPEEQAIQGEEIRRVAAALKKLTVKQRSAVLLRAEGLCYREIAAMLDVSIKRVSELIHRALTVLAGEL